MQKLAYTVEEFMEASSLGQTKVYELIQTGELKTAKIGGRRLIPVWEAEEWLRRKVEETMSEAV